MEKDRRMEVKGMREEGRKGEGRSEGKQEEYGRRGGKNGRKEYITIKRRNKDEGTERRRKSGAEVILREGTAEEEDFEEMKMSEFESRKLWRGVKRTKKKETIK